MRSRAIQKQNPAGRVTGGAETNMIKRLLIIVSGVLESALKVAALVDLARRPASEVRGSKFPWAVAISLTNSLGLVPITYFIYGRQRPPTTP